MNICIWSLLSNIWSTFIIFDIKELDLCFLPCLKLYYFKPMWVHFLKFNFLLASSPVKMKSFIENYMKFKHLQYKSSLQTEDFPRNTAKFTYSTPHFDWNSSDWIFFFRLICQWNVTLRWRSSFSIFIANEPNKWTSK